VTDEAEQIARAQAGDRQAFACLVESYWGPVCRWLAMMLRQVHLAEDLTQEVFLKVWRGLPAFRQEGHSFRAWLFAVARNCLVDNRRATRAEQTGVPEGLAGRDPDPAEDTLTREGMALLAKACTRLPEHFRSAFLLWSQEGLSFAEVGQALGINEETARWRVFKARLRLVAELRGYLDRNKP
jgi:RNA polymerase sigma-70 factor (ECF subfamily)